MITRPDPSSRLSGMSLFLVLRFAVAIPNVQTRTLGKPAENPLSQVRDQAVIYVMGGREDVHADILITGVPYLIRSRIVTDTLTSGKDPLTRVHINARKNFRLRPAVTAMRISNQTGMEMRSRYSRSIMVNQFEHVSDLG